MHTLYIQTSKKYFQILQIPPNKYSKYNTPSNRITLRVKNSVKDLSDQTRTRSTCRWSNGCKHRRNSRRSETSRTGRRPATRRVSPTVPFRTPAPWPPGSFPAKPFVCSPAWSAPTTIHGCSTQPATVSLRTRNEQLREMIGRSCGACPR